MLPRAEATNFHLEAVENSKDLEQRIRAIHRATGIQNRHTVVPDFLLPEEGANLFPRPLFKDGGPRTASRMAVYRETALPLAVSAVEKCLLQGNRLATDVTHLISVSCTGMYAPGLDIDLVTELGLATTVQRTAINFMGCYGAFPALKTANAICKADPHAKVIIVCVELCSLHFQQSVDDDTLLAMALFGDGAAAALVEGGPQNSGLEMEAFYADLAPEGSEDMAWKIGDFGFEMRLSSYVPQIIEGGIGTLTQRLLSSLGLKREDLTHFAIHPGGKSILQAIERQLSLDSEDNKHAYSVLKEAGNMSSPTVLFVLEKVLQELRSGGEPAKVLSFAFGPGLTLESCLYSFQP